jgi:hypothetical protein
LRFTHRSYYKLQNYFSLYPHAVSAVPTLHTTEFKYTGIIVDITFVYVDRIQIEIHAGTIKIANPAHPYNQSSS